MKDWDDKIPNDLRGLWKTNFELIRDLSNIRFARTVIRNFLRNLLKNWS